MTDNSNAPNCPRCGSWSPGGARFCHQCGYFLLTSRGRGYSFESSLGGGDLQTPGASQFRSKTSIAEHSWRAAVLAMGVGVGVLFDDWNPVWIPTSLIGYSLISPLWQGASILAGRMSRVELSQGDRSVVIKTRHVETDSFGKRRMLLGELPRQIDIPKLQHVATVCLPPADGGDGKKFSRPSLQKSGTFSQNDYRILRDEWLKTYYLLWVDSTTPQRGVRTTERCRRLLKECLTIKGVSV